MQNRQGETVLGWVLKFAASGLLEADRALALCEKLLDLGALASLPAFEEKVRLMMMMLDRVQQGAAGCTMVQ